MVGLMCGSWRAGDNPVQNQSQEREIRSGTSTLHNPFSVKGSPGAFSFSNFPAAYPQSTAAYLPVPAPCAPYAAIHPLSFPPPSTPCQAASAPSCPEAADIPSAPSHFAHLEQYW